MDPVLLWQTGSAGHWVSLSLSGSVLVSLLNAVVSDTCCSVWTSCHISVLCRPHETVVPLEDPIVTEVTSTLQEWALLWKQLYVVRSTQGFSLTHSSLIILISDLMRMTTHNSLKRDSWSSLHDFSFTASSPCSHISGTFSKLALAFLHFPSGSSLSSHRSFWKHFVVNEWMNE